MKSEIKWAHKEHTGHGLCTIEIEYENGKREKYFLSEYPEELSITEVEPCGATHTVFVSHEALALITAVAERAKKGRQDNE